MKVLRVLFAAMVAACGVVLLAPAPPASACSCRAATPAGYVDWADAVFVGTLAGPPIDEAEGPLISSSDPLVYTFDVEAVFHGSVGPVAEVESVRDGASCGLERMQVGRRYLMFAEEGRRQGVMAAGLCGGSQPATQGLIRRVETVTGAGRPPAQTAAVTDPSASVPASTPKVGYVLLGFSAVVLAAVAWALIPVRRKATRSA